MHRLKNWLLRVMTGRNGADELARVSSGFGCIVLLVSLLLPEGIVQSLIGALGFAGIIYSYFRIFSRNVYKRRMENSGWLRFRGNIVNRFRQWCVRRRQSKDYRFFRCEKCRTITRVPRGRGRIEITCPHCRNKFIRKS